MPARVMVIPIGSTTIAANPLALACPARPTFRPRATRRRAAASARASGVDR